MVHLPKYTSYYKQITALNQLLDSDISKRPDLLDTYQHQLNDLMRTYKDDASLGSDRYGLYQAQGLINFWRYELDEAIANLNQAIQVRGSDYAYARGLIADIHLEMRSQDRGNRINRGTYIISQLVAASIYIVIILLLSLFVGVIAGLNDKSIDDQALSTAILVIVYLTYVPLFVYTIYLVRARFHDMNHSSWWTLTLLIPLVSIVPSFILLFQRGTLDKNRFGSPPVKTKVFGL